MNHIDIETLIIGAGPAGLAAAMELHKAGRDFMVIDKSDQAGGLAKTYVLREGGDVFRTDNGPHRFFSKNPYLYSFVGDLLNERWITVRRQTRQYIDGKFYDYPVKAFQALRNMGPFKAMMIVCDYIIARVRFGIFQRPVSNFEDYVVARFGRSLAEFNMINYTEKIWGIPASDIDADWAEQRIKGLNLVSALSDVFRRACGFRGVEGSPKSLVDEFYYPDSGTGLIYETIVEKISAAGHCVLFQTQPISILFCAGGGFEILLRHDSGEETTVRCRYLIESIPIKDFVKLVQPSVPVSVLDAAANLRLRSQVYLFLTLNRDRVTFDQWVYFPSKNIPFARMSEMKNFSERMSPPSKTSLFVEFFCFDGDDVWNMTQDELFEYMMPHMERMGLFSRDEVRCVYHFRQKDAYPLYDLTYKQHLAVIKHWLDQRNDLFYIGRPGRFRYNNQDHSLEMGMIAAASIIHGTRYDIDGVGMEHEYFEKGAISFDKRPTV